VGGQISASLASARAYDGERRRAEALAQLDEAKTAFFSNVSHEFRTPLTLLLAPLEDTLRNGTSITDDVREELDLAHRNALRLLKLVNTLLDFSRIEAGRVEAGYEETDLGGYTAELVSSFRSACERAGLALTIDTRSGEPPVYIDCDMWEKIVLNLVSNAFKHTFTGGIAITVRSHDDMATVEVRDTGVGIAADQLPRLFDRFHRVPNAQSRTHEGTGIGLALVQELVRRHGGTITVESTEGIGSVFTVTLPAGSAHLPQDRLVPRSETRASERIVAGAAPYVQEVLRWLPNSDSKSTEWDSVTLSPNEGLAHSVAPNDGPIPVTGIPRILLADDNADMREYLARLLRTRGWDVEAVSDGSAALAAARHSPPDLVLSDVMMPGLDGFALVRALRSDEITRTIPTILLSARAGEEARVEGLQAGADDYLVKPFAPQELVARVATHLAMSQVRQESMRAVSEARDLLRRVLEQAPVAMIVFRGPDHVIEMANEFQLKLMGMRPAIGRPLLEAFPELQGQWIVPLIDEVYRTGTPRVVAARPISYDRDLKGENETRFFSISYYPLKESDGSVSRIICASSDVTHEERGRLEMASAQHEAEEARRVAEAANRAKSQFLAVMSHELRTPLNAISGHVQLMEMGIHGPVTPAQEMALDRINRSQRHLLRLISDVLNLSRIESGGVEYTIVDIALQDVVHSLMPMIEPQLQSKAMNFNLSLPVEPLLVQADR
ncbi:MAG: histidine kinase dimerization/phospho-acceptor domain-containing protein, partial [Gemmatimonadaceae bacterium]